MSTNQTKFKFARNLLTFSAAGILLASQAFAQDQASTGPAATPGQENPEFRDLDQDQDQLLLWREIHIVMDPQILAAGLDQERIFQQYDENKDDALDQQEFDNFVSGLQGPESDSGQAAMGSDGQQPAGTSGSRLGAASKQNAMTGQQDQDELDVDVQQSTMGGVVGTTGADVSGQAAASAEEDSLIETDARELSERGSAGMSGGQMGSDDTSADVAAGAPPTPQDEMWSDSGATTDASTTDLSRTTQPSATSETNMGTAGMTGTAGTTGTTSTTDTAGMTGTAGTRDTAGTAGVAGTTGTAGTRDTAGTAGVAGTTGTAGDRDSAGMTGTAGTRDTTGMTGTAGTAGVAAGASNQVESADEIETEGSLSTTSDYEEFTETETGDNRQAAGQASENTGSQERSELSGTLDSAGEAVPDTTGAAADVDVNQPARASGSTLASDAGAQPAGGQDIFQASVESVKDKPVLNSAGETLGKVNEVVVNSQTGDVGLVISSGGVLGLGATKILVPVDEVNQAGEKLVWDTEQTKKELKNSAKYQGDDNYQEISDGSQTLGNAGSNANVSQSAYETE